MVNDGGGFDLANDLAEDLASMASCGLHDGQEEVSFITGPLMSRTQSQLLPEQAVSRPPLQVLSSL